MKAGQVQGGVGGHGRIPTHQQLVAVRLGSGDMSRSNAASGADLLCKLRPPKSDWIQLSVVKKLLVLFWANGKSPPAQID